MKIRFYAGDKVKSRTRPRWLDSGNAFHGGSKNAGLLIGETEKDWIGIIIERNAFNEYLVEFPNGQTYWIKSRHLLGAR